MIPVLISSCLLGTNCRYDGKNCFAEDISLLKDKCLLIPICPEQMGGLSTPRYPSEIQNGKVINSNNIDVTKEYKKGAEASLAYAKLNNIKYAILKSKSPSCGLNKIYDGTFSKKLIDGNGITAQLLIDNGIKVYTEKEISTFIKEVIDK